MSKVTAITYNNFKQYLGKKVEVEISCYAYGLMYPDNNILMGMSENDYYFLSEGGTENECYWHWPVDKDVQDKNDCSIQVWDYNEYMAFYNNARTKI